MRRADARFVLPVLPRRAVLVGTRPEWAEGLRLAQCAVVDPAEGDLDVVVTGRRGLQEALRTRTDTILVEGGLGAVPQGWSSRRWRVLLRRDEPLALAPSCAAAPLRHAVGAWAPSSPAKAVVRRGLLTAAAAGVAPGLPVVTVLTRGDSEPACLRTARELGAQGHHQPVVLTGGGNLRRRVATLLFAPGADRPTWVLKTERTAGGHDRGVRDQEAAAVAGRVPGVQVPQVVGRSAQSDGPASTLEDAAHGLPLARVLLSHPDEGRRALLALVQWLQDLAVATRSRDDAPVRDRRQEEHELQALWPGLPQVGQAVRAAAPAPSVLTHGDVVDGGNVLVDDGRLAVLDWELARLDGWPLLDLLPVLAHGLAVLRVGRVPADVAAEVVRCAAGESPDSPLLHRSVLSWAAALQLDPATIGPLAAVAWASLGGFPQVLHRLLVDAGLPSVRWDASVERIATGWLRHPALGVTWPALRFG